jgi:hypothetical protein
MIGGTGGVRKNGGDGAVREVSVHPHATTVSDLCAVHRPRIWAVPACHERSTRGRWWTTGRALDWPAGRLREPRTTDEIIPVRRVPSIIYMRAPLLHPTNAGLARTCSCLPEISSSVGLPIHCFDDNVLLRLKVYCMLLLLLHDQSLII